MTLKYTDDQIRDRFSSMIGRGKHPNAWWAWIGGSDCMAGISQGLGIRTSARDQTPWQISIAAFRAHFGWDEVPVAEAKAGMLIAEYWPGEHDPATSKVPNHIEYIHGIDHAAGTITTDSANTGPRPGQRTPINFYRKTRTITPANFLFAIVIPAKGAPDTSPAGGKAPTDLSKSDVKTLAAFVNEWADRNKLDLPRTTAMKDGIPGENLWRLVQTWGRKNGIYGPGFIIDGIRGPRTLNVAAVALKRAKAINGK